VATARSAARLEARNGASIRNDKPIATNAKGERTLAVWRPTDQGMAADELFEHGPEARPPIGGELRENIIVAQTNKGRTIRGALS
jgi:hypothetical protein